MRALVTGFDPFGGAAVNSSLDVVRRLPPRVAGVDIEVAELPTSFSRSHVALAAALSRTAPDLVLCVGQAAERAALCVERVAVNIQHAETADNDGACPVDATVVSGGPAAYLATVPVRDAVAALHEAGLPAQVSMSAGTFVCNHVFYHLMHLAATERRRLRGGFLHVPALSPRAAGDVAPQVTLADLARGVEIVLAVSSSANGRKAKGK